MEKILFNNKPKPKPKSRLVAPKKTKVRTRTAKTQVKKTPPKQDKEIKGTPLRKNELKFVQAYLNEYGASCMGMFIFTLAIIAFLSIALVNGNPVQVGLLLVGAINIFFLFELVRIVMEQSQKRKLELVGKFDKSAKPADTKFMRTNYMAQKIGKQTLIFPPEFYFSLQKGETVQLFYTPIFKIVVGYDKK